MIHNLKYQGPTTLGCKYIGIRKSEFVAMAQFLSELSLSQCQPVDICWIHTDKQTDNADRQSKYRYIYRNRSKK